MKNLILLPGKSPSNASWIQDLAQALSQDFGSVFVQRYDHWEDENAGMIDLDQELQKLAAAAENLSGYTVVAKSAGVILALRAIYEKKILPEKCVFIGSAFLWALSCRLELEKWLAAYSVPTLFIQQTLDPAMYFDELKKFLELLGVQNYGLEELPGKSHQYKDIAELAESVKKFVN